MPIPEPEFHVFLCHNNDDKPAVREIFRLLEARGLKPWLDERHLRSGFPWQSELELQIKNIGAAAVFVGAQGPWREQGAFLREFVERGCPVILVILPGSNTPPELPVFLKGLAWVDFRVSYPDPLEQLALGIRGQTPARVPGDFSGHNPRRQGKGAFVGREAELDQLHALLQDSRPTVIRAPLHDVGGVGKTALALQYARRHKDDYSLGVCLLENGDPLIGFSSFAAENWRVRAPQGLGAEAQLAYLLRNLPRGAALIVLDDFAGEFPDFLRRLPPEYRVLLTRREDPGPGFQVLSLGELSPGAALDLLGKLMGEEEWSGARREEAVSLCKWLGGLPLALELVGNFLRLNPGLSPADVESRLREKSLEHPAPGGALALSSEPLSDGARELALLLAQLGAAKVHLSLIKDITRRFAGDGFDSQFWDGARRELGERSLLEQPQAGYFRLHLLVREFFQSQLTPEQGEDMGRAVAFCLAREAEEIPEAATRPDLVAHWEWACEGLTDALEEDDLIRPFVALGRYYELYNNLKLALQFRKSCLAVCESLLGAEHPNTGTSLNNLAELYESQGDYDAAFPLYERALAIYEKALGAEHQFSATSLNNLAVLYYSQGNYDSALPLFERALEICENALGGEHPDTAIGLDNLALLHRAQGNYDSAVPLAERALTIREKVLGPGHPDTAKSLNNLGAFYEAQGRYNSAQPLYERALAIREGILGGDHPDTATSLNNLAVLYQTQGKFDSALPLSERALAIREKALGAEHPSTASSLDCLAGLYKSKGDYDSALPLYVRALEISEKTLGAEHPDTASSLNSLASLYEAQGDYDSALPLCERALTIREKVFGAEHPSTAVSLNNLAALFKSQGDYDSALPLYERALEIFEQTLGAEHPDTKVIRKNLERLKLDR